MKRVQSYVISVVAVGLVSAFLVSKAVSGDAVKTMERSESAASVLTLQSGHTGIYGGARPLAPYSPGVDAGETVYLSGQVGINPESGSLHDGVEAQARQALENLHKLLTEAGLSKSHVVRATVYLDDIENYGALNAVYGDFFEEVDVKPSRSTVGVAALPIGAAVEIDFIAVK